MIFENAKRPLIIFGWGIHLAKAENEAVEFAHKLGVPVICTWGAADLFRHDDPLYIGTFGTHGNRAANFALQNADVVLSIGSRLDTKATGSPASDFARNAKVHMVDIDSAEIDKFKRLGREVHGIPMDAGIFMWQYLCQATASLGAVGTLYSEDRLEELRNEVAAREEWIIQTQAWKKKYPGYDPTYKLNGINPYEFIDRLSSFLNPDDIIVSDTGCPVGWMMQAFKFTGQRFYHAWNNTPMGYGLPAAIGAAFAAPDSRIICITGDGGLSVNITELATLARHQLNVKVILFNNKGHAMCRQTQRTWMGGTYPSTSYEGGLATPNFTAVAAAYGIRSESFVSIDYDNIASMSDDRGPRFVELCIDLDYQIVPQVKAGKPLEDADPPLSREELAEVMQ